MGKSIIDLCKEKLVAMSSANPLLIPKVIEDFARENPSRIICNEITEEIATAIINHDQIRLMVLVCFGGLTHPLICELLKKIQKGDCILVHFYKEKNFYTCVVKLMYNYDFLIIHEKPKGCIKLCRSHGGIEYNSIIAIAKVPKFKKIAEKYLLDNDQNIFLKIAKRI